MSRLKKLTKTELIERLRLLQSEARDPQDTKRPECLHTSHVGEERDSALPEPWHRLLQAIHHHAELYEYAPVGCVILGHDARIHDINLTGAAMLGWERAWLRGRSLAPWIVRDDLKVFYEHLAKSQQVNGKALHEIRLKNRHGQFIEVRLQSARIPDREHSPSLCQTALIDITEHRRAEQNATLLQAQLSHVARLNTVGEMASNLAHELNQPLGAIVLYCDACADMLESGINNEDGLIEAFKEISNAAQHAGEIIRHLRRFLQKDHAQRAAIDVNTIIRQVTRLMEAEARNKDTLIQLDLRAGLREVTVDRVHIEQVLVNLLRNSIDAMDTARTAVRRLTISTDHATNNVLQVSVRDTGPGVSLKGYSRVFDPFYTTKTSGMGMGLSISRSIVEAHAGRLWVEAGPGNGAVFHFTLPVGADANPNA